MYRCPGPPPPGPTFPTTDEMNEAIADAIEKHNNDPEAHAKLLANYATIEYVDSLLGSTKVNNIETISKESVENQYTYNPDLNAFEFDIKDNGAVIRLYEVSNDIKDLNLKFDNNIDGKDISVYINKTTDFNINYFSNNTLVPLFVSEDLPNGEYELTFITVNSDTIKFVNANIL